MPFTPAHTALVLPFIKSRRLSATGLLIGSMAPDFEYFFKMSVSSRMSHTLGGIFYFDIPATFILAILFHEVIKKNLIDNLPVFLQQRLQPLYHLQFISYLKKNVVAFVVSILVGACSHILWDSFTHGNSYFVTELSFIYKGVYVPVEGAKYPLWYALQFISTVVGLVALLLYVVYIKPQPVSGVKPSALYWVGVAVVVASVLAVRFGGSIRSVSIEIFAVCFISALCLGVIAMGMFPFRKKKITHG